MDNNNDNNDNDNVIIIIIGRLYNVQSPYNTERCILLISILYMREQKLRDFTLFFKTHATNK